MTSPADLICLARRRASFSAKENTKVGALLVDEENKVIFEATNDYIFPLYNNCSGEPEENRQFYSEHAERRLIFSAVRSGFCDFQKKTLVITHFPCCDCARAIILVGIKKIIVSSQDIDDGFLEKWKRNLDVSKRMLEKNGIEILFA